jgi:hypothetical protein
MEIEKIYVFAFLIAVMEKFFSGCHRMEYDTVLQLRFQLPAGIVKQQRFTPIAFDDSHTSGKSAGGGGKCDMQRAAFKFKKHNNLTDKYYLYQK